MDKKKIILCLVGLSLLGGIVFAGIQWFNRDVRFITPANKAQVMRGKKHYDFYCASCHGSQLEGQANWRLRMANGRLPAPPHDETGHTWHHPDSVLIDITKHGLVPGKTAPGDYVSDMPAYANILSDSDIIDVLAYIKSTWPAEILKIQKEISLSQ